MKTVEDKIRTICDRYGFDIEPDQKVYEMTVSQKQTLEIVKTLYRGANVLILDEPCHALDEDYRERILDLLETVAATDTTTLLHVTHEEGEVLSCEKHILELCPGESPMYRILTR